MNETELIEKREGSLFEVRASIRKHNRRAGFFNFLHRITGVVGLIGGSAVVASLWKKWPSGAVVSGLIVAGFSAFDLLWGFSNRAALHMGLRNRFIELEQDLADVSDAEFTEQMLSAARKRRSQIEKDEPPELRVLALICRNEQIRATYGKDTEYTVSIGGLRRAVAPFFDWKLHELKQAKDITT